MAVSINSFLLVVLYSFSGGFRIGKVMAKQEYFSISQIVSAAKRIRNRRVVPVRFHCPTQPTTSGNSGEVLAIVSIIGADCILCCPGSVSFRNAVTLLP